MQDNNPYDRPLDDKLKEHSYDGIHEYDKRLPNWWLNTLYISIVVSIVYWFSYYDVHVMQTDEQKLAAGMQAVAELRNAGADVVIDDDVLIAMSKDLQVVSAGQKTYLSICAPCHGMKMEGGVGVNLVDAEWKYGGKPLEILAIVNNGSPDISKGMVAWEPALGPKKTAEVVAFILSKQQ